MTDQPDFVDIVFDGPPDHVSGRFVEVEDSLRASIHLGEWVHRDDGYWALRIPRSAPDEATMLKVARAVMITTVSVLSTRDEFAHLESPALLQWAQEHLNDGALLQIIREQVKT